MHTYIHTYLHTYIPTYIPTYIHTYVHTYNAHMHTYKHTHTYIRTYNGRSFAKAREQTPCVITQATIPLYSQHGNHLPGMESAKKKHTLLDSKHAWGRPKKTKRRGARARWAQYRESKKTNPMHDHASNISAVFTTRSLTSLAWPAKKKNTLLDSKHAWGRPKITKRRGTRARWAQFCESKRTNPMCDHASNIPAVFTTRKSPERKSVG